MKPITLLAALLLYVSSVSAQELQLDSLTKKWMYRGTVAVDSASAADLYERARLWASSTYKMPADQVRELKESGQVVVVGNWLKIAQLANSDVMRHVLTIDVKDGRVRYTFTDLVIEHKTGMFAGSLEYMEKTTIKKHRTQYAERCAAAAGDLERALRVKVAADW